MPEGDNPFIGQLSTADALLFIRKRLLDLTTRNRLLSFRWTRGRVVRVVHTGVDDLYDHLKSGGSLVFRPVPEPRKEDYVNPGTPYLIRLFRKSCGMAGVGTNIAEGAGTQRVAAGKENGN